jgi:hypothetical protein
MPTLPTPPTLPTLPTVGVTGCFMRAIVVLPSFTLDAGRAARTAGRTDKTVMGAW